jgi:hypothetical protein
MIMANTTTDSLKLASLWTKLGEMQGALDNEIIPLASHLSLDDPELMIALEELSAKITAHFDRFKLVAEVRKQR